jgi:hypothetical protein
MTIGPHEPPLQEHRRKILSHTVQPLAIEYRGEIVGRYIANFEPRVPREDTGLHRAIRHDRQYATSAHSAELVLGGAGCRVPSASDPALIVHADHVPMDSDPYEFLRRTLNVLVLRHADQPDTERDASSNCLFKIRLSSSMASGTTGDLVVELCA